MGVKRCEEASRIPSLLLLSSFRLACVILFRFRGWWVCAVCHGLVWLTWHFWLTSARSGAGHERSLAGGSRHQRGWLVSRFHGGGGGGGGGIKPAKVYWKLPLASLHGGAKRNGNVGGGI